MTKKNPLSILLVDDDKDMCESLTDVISLDSDYNVSYTTDPLKALEAVMDGHTVMPIKDASATGDIFVTVTGDLNVISKSCFPKDWSCFPRVCPSSPVPTGTRCRDAPATASPGTRFGARSPTRSAGRQVMTPSGITIGKPFLFL